MWHTCSSLNFIHFFISLVYNFVLHCRCFTFGIGSGASTALVKGVARAGKGTAEFVTGQEDRLQAKVRHRVLMWMWHRAVFIRPFSGSLVPLFQSESKWLQNHSNENDVDLNETETACRTHFHMKGFALRLVLRQRHENSEMAFCNHSNQSQGTQTIQWSNQNLKYRCNYMQLMQSAVKQVWVSQNWFSFYLWLDEKWQKSFKCL